MELKELEYIVAIAEEGSISRAADRLYMAQSSLSQFLSRYEAELNTKLFLRTAGGVRPTASGELYIKNAKQMLRQYHLVKCELRDMGRPSEGRVEFGISTFRGSYLIPKVLRQFHQEAPAVELVIHEYDSLHLQRKIAAGELDLALVAFRQDRWQERRPDQSQLVMQDEVLLVATREHPVMQYVQVGHGGPDRPWVDLSEITHLEFLLSNRSTLLGSVAQQQFELLGIEPRAVNTNLTAPFAAALARQGLGLAFTYRSCIEEYPDVEYLSIGKDRCFVNLVLMYPPEGYRSRAVRALEHTIRRHLEAQLG
ncbi:MAG: LysR family transcriptional regulator [Candidatus Faecousia sp.]|nr:LysR family transcriptional regulator [Clostridiales bacterium]MDD7651175.1 LysR family transcriptional regulator [Bacillota bacterium]MDY4218999.1 LysR family transcriptional regulator [Candidatus Faecousia sp.]